MITADNPYVLFEGSEVKYTSTSIYVDFTYDNRFQIFRCNILPLGAAASAPALGSYFTNLSKSTVDAKTGSGTNPSDKLINQVDQVIADYLDAITENSGVTFTA